MIISKVLKSYTDIPTWILNILGPFYYLIPKSKRYGKTFKDTRELLQKAEKMSEQHILQIKNEMLQKAIIHAYENVPYYKCLFDEYQIDPYAIKNEKDLDKIPFLTKDILREKKDELIAKDVDRNKLNWITTSGSTGNPVGFYVDENNAMQEWAYGTYLYQRAGWKDDCSKLMLRGKVFYGMKKGKKWQYDAFKRELSVDIFDMTDANNEAYCRAIEKYKPDNVYGYMSAIVTLCKYIEKRKGGLKHQFKAAYACSENIIPMQREYVERILNVRIFSNYGHSERLILAGECEYSNEYHIEPLYGVAELVDEQGNVIDKPGQIGELIGTGFCNQGMPMIRYRTGDLAAWSTIEKCPCGRSHKRLARIEGRWKQDVLVNVDGAIVTLTALNMHSDVFKHVVKYQLYQEEVGKVLMKIVPNEKFVPQDTLEIERQLYEKTGNKIILQVVLVEDIPLNKNGKYKIVDQRLEINTI